VDNDPTIQAIAKEELGSDSRLKLVLSDGAEFLERCESQFDFIFADTWAGKYTHMELCMELLRPSGIWVIDDMLPQPNWPDGHAERAAKLLSELNHLTGFQVTRFSWSTGLVVAVKLPTS
jgi:predicted O-methyltransferase YrrM